MRTLRTLLKGGFYSNILVCWSLRRCRSRLIRWRTTPLPWDQTSVTDLKLLFIADYLTDPRPMLSGTTQPSAYPGDLHPGPQIPPALR